MSKQKWYDNKEFLYDRRVKQGKSIEELSIMFGVSVQYVYRLLRKHGIK